MNLIIIALSIIGFGIIGAFTASIISIYLEHKNETRIK